jgi:hypothetical protein
MALLSCAAAIASALPRTTPTPAVGVHTLRADGRMFRLAAEAGATHVVQLLSWREIEPARGEFRWEYPDSLVRAAAFYGLKLVLRLDQQPRWARDTELNAPPDDPEDYGRFASAVAARYRGRIHAYIVWNEPNLAVEWGGRRPDPHAYAALLAVTHRHLKAADPAALVVSAGLAPTNERSHRAEDERLFLDALYAAGAGAHFDILGAHVYGFGRPPDSPAGAGHGLNFRRLAAELRPN